MTDTPAAPPAPPENPPSQPRNPLHGVRLEDMVIALAEFYGWVELAERIPVRCFAIDPSVKSSLKFLRKTPWAREKVEGLYLYTLREQKRAQRLAGGRAAAAAPFTTPAAPSSPANSPRARPGTARR